MLRASDADRERTARRLRHAAGEGRLSADELEQRLQGAFSAETYDELDWLVCDLPTDHEPNRPKRLQALRPVQWKPAVMLAVAMLVGLILIAGAAGVRVGRSSAAASGQPAPPGQAQAQTP
jgi:hypothetical protein